MNINRRRKQQGLSLLPVLALTAILATVLVGLAGFKSGANVEDVARHKMAATSAINKAAVELRTTGSLPASKTVTVDGIQVQLETALSADGHTLKMTADGQGEVVQATAVRADDVAPAAQAPAAQSAGQATMASVATAMNTAGMAVAATKAGGIQSKTDLLSGWTVYNSDNVVISKDSTNRQAILNPAVAEPVPAVAESLPVVAEPVAVLPTPEVPTKTVLSKESLLTGTAKVYSPSAAETPTATAVGTLSAIATAIKSGQLQLNNLFAGKVAGPKTAGAFSQIQSMFTPAGQ